MTQTVFKIVWCTLLVSATWSSAFAQDQFRSVRPQAFPTPNAKPMRMVRQPVRTISRTTEPQASSENNTPVNAQPANGGAYPVLSAPLYPSPIPNVPPQIGGTLITNPALAPHETLYPHKYKAMYPPFYFKVRGSWLWTPWGVRSHDVWELRGTEVSVQYKTKYPWRQPFVPPAIR
ncbi:MAG: hypothetical protein O2955_12855 [Planctomycetota bacterium]|nr:hypothetical protein [Planctomycetota bacterium]MDA1213398.1 hypothetical protein [Planctomycetota bacterium]